MGDTALRLAFNRFCRESAHDGVSISYIVWKDWESFVRGLPSDMFEWLPLKTQDSAKRALAECVDAYGDIASFDALDVPRPRLSGSGKRPKSMLGFPEIHTLLWHMSLVNWADNYIANYTKATGPAGAPKPKKTKRIDVLTDEAWVSVAPHFCLERNDLQPMSIEELCEFIQELAARASGVSLDVLLVKDHVVPLCQLVEPSMLLAKTIGRCSFMVELVGAALRSQLRSFLHCAAHGLEPVPHPNSTADVVLQELVETRQALARLKSAAAHNFRGHYDTEVNAAGETFIARSFTVHDLSSRAHAEAIKTRTLDWAVQGKVAFSHAPTCLVDAERAIEKITTGEEHFTSNLLDSLVSRCTIGRHAIVLDSALDEMHKDRIDQVV